MATFGMMIQGVGSSLPDAVEIDDENDDDRATDEEHTNDAERIATDLFIYIYAIIVDALLLLF